MLRDLLVGMYFFLLFYVAFYGLHIYWLIGLYLRHRSECRQPPPIGEDLPVVTVQLPIYNERAVVRRLIKRVSDQDWPRDKLEIQVLDDSDDDTVELAAAEVARLKALGFNIVHLHRITRDGYKAGALANGLKKAGGEFVAIFDADNLPHPDFLKRMIGYFNDASIGMVQARWTCMVNCLISRDKRHLVWM